MRSHTRKIWQQTERLRAGVLEAYRWQYIVSGVEDPRFMGILGSMITLGAGRSQILAWLFLGASCAPA
jgi:hypothetical protein